LSDIAPFTTSTASPISSPYQNPLSYDPLDPNNHPHHNTSRHMKSCTNSIQALSRSDVTGLASEGPVLRFNLLPDDVHREFRAFRCNDLQGKAPTGLPPTGPHVPTDSDTGGRPSCIDTSDAVTAMPRGSDEPIYRCPDDDQTVQAVTALSR
jgi:hypothetical protein